MKIFVTDLDNTLIYSHKKNIGTEKVSVETNENIEVSFMSKYSHELLRNMDFIPLTTRSLTQYERIEFFKNYIPEYALVANGGILLHRGVVDKLWYKESIEISNSSNEELIKSIDILENDENVYYKAIKIDDLFLFAKSSISKETVAKLANELNLEKIEIYNQGDKIYVFPKKINKGEALERLRIRLKSEFIICAGDSILDISMLKKAEIAICPKELSGTWENINKKYIISKEEIFSDRVLEIVKKYL